MLVANLILKIEQKKIDFYRLYTYAQPSSFNICPHMGEVSETFPLGIKFKMIPQISAIKINYVLKRYFQK